MLKLILGKFAHTVKIVRSVKDSTLDHEQFEIGPIRDHRFRM